MAETDNPDVVPESFTPSLARLGDDISLLVRQDLEAARVEMMEKIKGAGLGAGMLSGSAIAGFFTLVCLTILLIVLLSLALKLWLAILIVTVLWGITGAVLALAGKSKIQSVGSPLPEQSIKNFKEDLRSAKRELRSARQ